MFQGEGMYPAPTHKRDKELDAKISKLQKSTRVSIQFMTGIHEVLRHRFRWYYNWHMNSWSDLVHWLALAGYTVTAFALLFTLVIKDQVHPSMAASKQGWSTAQDWKDWQLDNLSVGKDGLQLAVKDSVQGYTATRLAQASPIIDQPVPTDASPDATKTPTDPSAPAADSGSTTVNSAADSGQTTPATVNSTSTATSGSVQTVDKSEKSSTIPESGSSTSSTTTTTSEVTNYQTIGTATIAYDPHQSEVVAWLNSESDEVLNGGTIKKEFSTDDILWAENAKELANSDKIYMRLTFNTPDAKVSPVLKNFILDFSRLPETPTGLAVTRKLGVLGYGQVLSAGDFSDPDNDSHQASEWQVTNQSGQYTSTIVDSGLDTKNLTSYPINRQLADGGYYFRVRYEDSTGAWSPWSQESAFTVAKNQVAVLGNAQIQTNKNEIVGKRTATTSTIDNKNGTDTLESFTGLVHYKTDYSNPKSPWLDINPNHSVDYPDYVLYDQMPSTVKVYKNQIGYEIVSRQTGEKYTVTLENVDGNPVLSQAKSTDGLVAWADINDPITQEKAQNKYFAQFISPVLADDTMAQTTDNGNLKFEFEISQNGVRLWKTITGSDAPTNFTWKITKDDSRLKGKSDLSFRSNPDAYDITNTTTDAVDTTKPVKIDAHKTSGDMDSSFTWQETAPKTDMKIDTDIIYNPDASPGTTTVDGIVVNGGTNLTWASVHDAATGQVASYTDAVTDFAAVVSDTNSNGWNAIARSIFMFDTSNIGSGSTISSATFSLYGTGKTDTAGWGPSLGVFPFSSASTTTLSFSDFNKTNFGNSATSYASPIPYSSWSIAGYNNFSLNSSGLAGINTTGLTKFGVRDYGFDANGANGAAPTWVASQSATFSGDYADSGTSHAPKLDVIYTTPTGITISGTAYTSDTKSSTVTDGTTVGLSINGGTKLETSTLSGVFTFANMVVSPNDTITLYLAGGTYKGNLITQAVDATTGITGLELYANDIALSHQTPGPMTNALLSTANNCADCSTSIHYTDSSGAVAFDSGYKVIILSGKTYTPGGAVTANNISVNGTFSPEGPVGNQTCNVSKAI